MDWFLYDRGFRHERVKKALMLSKPARPYKEVIQNLFLLKRFNHSVNVQGSELLDCEDEEIALVEFQQECIKKEEINEHVL